MDSIYKRVYEKVVSLYKTNKHFYSGPHDETFFSLRVYETAKKIIAGIDEQVREEEILLACILHDIGKIKIDADMLFSLDDKNASGRKITAAESKEGWDIWHQHPQLSVPIARDILTEESLSEDKIDFICNLIDNHAKHNDYTGVKSIELQILQDADIIADVGYSGFIRGYLYAGKFKIPTIEQVKYMQNQSRIQDGHEFNLDFSKKLALKQQTIQDELSAKMTELIKSDLL